MAGERDRDLELQLGHVFENLGIELLAQFAARPEAGRHELVLSAAKFAVRPRGMACQPDGNWRKDDPAGDFGRPQANLVALVEVVPNGLCRPCSSIGAVLQ